jgi:hypothetical protein
MRYLGVLRLPALVASATHVNTNRNCNIVAFSAGET